MTGNGGLPHLKIEHQEMQCRSDERQKCLRKMSNGEKLGMLGGDCLLYWKFLPGFGGWGRKPVVAWVWVLLFACVFFALLCARGARVSLTSSLARGSSLSCHLLSPRQALSQMTDFKWGCPEVSSAGYLHVFSALGSMSLLQH